MNHRQHSNVLFIKFKEDTREDIEKWKAERRKKFPTLEKVQQKETVVSTSVSINSNMEKLFCFLCGKQTIKMINKIESNHENQKVFENVDTLNEFFSDPEKLKTIFDLNLQSAYTCQFCQKHIDKAIILIKQLKEIETIVTDLIFLKEKSSHYHNDDTPNKQTFAADEDNNVDHPEKQDVKRFKSSSSDTGHASYRAELTEPTNTNYEEEYDDDNIESEEEEDELGRYQNYQYQNDQSDCSNNNSMPIDRNSHLNNNPFPSPSFNAYHQSDWTPVMFKSNSKCFIPVPPKYDGIVKFQKSLNSVKNAMKALNWEKLWRKVAVDPQRENGVFVIRYLCKIREDCPVSRWIFYHSEDSGAHLYESRETQHNHEGGGLNLRGIVHSLMDEGDFEPYSVYQKLIAKGVNPTLKFLVVKRLMDGYHAYKANKEKHEGIKNMRQAFLRQKQLL